MNRMGSNTTSDAAGGVSWWANSTNTMINGGSFATLVGDVNLNLQHPMTIQRGLDLLYQHIAPGAVYNSAERYDPPKCLPRTREAILHKIMAWVELRTRNIEFFLWLYGAAGAGKSAIAQTISEMCEIAGLLAASFFFSRTAAGRNDMSRLVPTIVYQLIQSIPEIRDRVLMHLGNDPHILSRAPSSQMRILIIDPLNSVPPAILAERPGFIVIDGLDECGHPDSQREILNFLASAISQLNTPLLFLIASRPEPDIRLSFHSDVLKLITHSIPLQHSSETSKDIRRFLQTKFQEIRSTHPMRTYIDPFWPHIADIEAIVNKATGQFIYAATVMRYVQSSLHRPEDRLETILALRSDEDEPFAGLDSLYLQILSSINKEQLAKILDILRCVIFIWGPGHHHVKRVPRRLEDFLCFRRGDLSILLKDLHALVNFPPPEKPTSPITIYHASFPDFLLDRARSGEFFLDSPTSHASIACRWIPYMEQTHKLEKWEKVKMAEWVNMEFYHISRAACTPQLNGILIHFNFFEILKGNDRYAFSLQKIPNFLTWLHQNRDSGALSAEAFSAQFEHFDQYVRHALESLPPLYQKCIPAAVSLTPFYGRAKNATRLVFIIGSFAGLSQLFYNHPRTEKWDRSFTVVVKFLGPFFSNPSRSGPFTVTEQSYLDLAFQCAKVAFDSSWTPDDGRVDPTWEENTIDAYRRTAMAFFSLALPKASKSFELARFLQEHAFRDCASDRLCQERRELTTMCLNYMKSCGVLPRKPADRTNCVVDGELTRFDSSLEGIQMWVRYLLGFT